MNVLVKQHGRVSIITINRPKAKNAVDRETSRNLIEAFKKFDEDPESDVAILTGSEGIFCADAAISAYILKSLLPTSKFIFESLGWILSKLTKSKEKDLSVLLT